jgi:antirestriction protein ArdC
MNRKVPVRFGGREWRVLIEARPSRPNAEMASAFVCASLGIVPTVRHTDYLASWLDVLREDNRAIFRAASAASKAAEFLLAFAPDAAAPQSGDAA